MQILQKDPLEAQQEGSATLHHPSPGPGAPAWLCPVEDEVLLGWECL